MKFDTKVVLFLSLLHAAACGSENGDNKTDPEQAATCSGLELGRCGVVGSLAACTGAEAADETTFAPLEDGGLVELVGGFQGLTMFAFAARADGIAPGAAATEWPVVELKVHRTEYSVVARFRGRAQFVADPGAADSFVNTDLFAIVETSVPIEDGQQLTVKAALTDATGNERCGELTFAAAL